jgi:hypothetical protein
VDEPKEKRNSTMSADMAKFGHTGAAAAVVDSYQHFGKNIPSPSSRLKRPFPLAVT